MNSEYFQRWYRHAGPLPIYPKECSDAVLTLSLSLGLGWVYQIRSDQISTEIYSTWLSKRPVAAVVWKICKATSTKVTKELITCGQISLIVSTECTGAPGRLMHPWRFLARIKRQDP